MYETIQSVHSILAYAALGLLVLASINAIFGLTSKKLFTDKDLRLSLFTLIICHIQLLVGLILYFVSPLGLEQLGNMKDAAVRLTSLEHPLINIIALTNASFIRFGWYYFIFLVLALPQIFYFIKQLEIRKLFKAGIYLYYSLLFFRLLIVYDDGDFMPYKTIFQDFDRNSQWEFMDKR